MKHFSADRAIDADGKQFECTLCFVFFSFLVRFDLSVSCVGLVGACSFSSINLVAKILEKVASHSHKTERTQKHTKKLSTTSNTHLQYTRFSTDTTITTAENRFPQP